MPAVKDSRLPSGQPGSIIGIQGETVDFNLKQHVLDQMNPTDGPRSLPTMLLYDEKGLQLFENITYLDQYYLTNCEIALLEKHSADIAKNIPDGSIVVELGSGNLRKVCLLLNAFERAGKNIDYYALDLDYSELQRTLANVPDFKHVRCHGLHGTYDDGREWLRQFNSSERHVCVLHLGSSIGNFNRDDAADFLHSFANVLKDTDSMLIGIDSCCDPDKVYHAYNDKEGVTHQFILNALNHANDIFDKEVFNVADWQVIGEYVYDEDGGRHQAFLSPLHETFFDGVPIQAHERLKIEQSLKYSQIGADKLWRMSGFAPFQHWRLGDDYGLHLLKPAPLPFSTIPERYAASCLPSLRDWETLWTAWDTVTKNMLPPQDLQEKPIKLRNACVFYLGHIPTFLDIQLQKMAKLPPTEPANYQSIFERGIDPDVDNPEQCHDHSSIPDEWPPVAEIEAFQARVRARLVKLYETGNISRDVGRAIWIGFEHEAMHLETLLYMLLQSDRTLPPPHTGTPDFAALAEKARLARVDNEWFDIPAQTITLGMNDSEDVKDSAGHYGWDNEKPQRKTEVHAFQAQARPITNNEYAKYLQDAKIDKLPASWVTSPIIGSPTTSHVQGKSIRTVYGVIPLKYALDWPVLASYDELAGCAAWMGGRIPTMEEAKSIYQQVEHQKDKERFTRSKLANNVPAVNAHLVNDGVEETPPLTSSEAVDEENLFIDLSGANVGFRHWFPQPVTARGGQLAGQGDVGGAWEWTSSALTKHDGFTPMSLYPAYTADFFDGKHNIVLGGSWATHPRIAGRKSFVNWYQTNYPYAWVTARVVRDI